MVDPNDHLRQLAKKNQVTGLLYEPRMYYDVIRYTSSSDARQAGNPDIFRNGEKYPVRITHITAAVLPASAASPALSPAQGDERMVQRYNLRVRAHDDWYMQENFVPLPLWHNVVQAAGDVITRSTATYNLRYPLILGQRDTLEIETRLEEATSNGARTIGMSADGVGMMSRRPKRLASTTDRTTTDETTLDTDRFRNDGAEPMEIHSLTFQCSAEANDGDPTGNIRQARCRIRHIGNGTNEWWMVGPIGPSNDLDNHCPMVLLGKDVGRAIVHALPQTVEGPEGLAPGWLLEPGEGVTIETEAVTTGREEPLAIGMLGYAIVT